MTREDADRGRVAPVVVDDVATTTITPEQRQRALDWFAANMYDPAAVSTDHRVEDLAEYSPARVEIDPKVYGEPVRVMVLVDRWPKLPNQRIAAARERRRRLALRWSARRAARRARAGAYAHHLLTTLGPELGRDANPDTSWQDQVFARIRAEEGTPR